MNKKRNVILLTIDSLRADHLGCLGYSRDISPNVDRLAGEGVLFSQAISNGSNTPSSFPSIITSSYSYLHPAREEVLFEGRRYKVLFLSSDRMTLAEVLKESRYSTAAFIAKNPYISSFFHYDRGFDVFYDQFEFKGIKPNNRILHIPTRPLQVVKYVLGRKPDSANVINRRTISWLKKNRNSFFLWLHYMDVHLPYNPSGFVERMKALRLYRKLKKKSNSRYLSGDEFKILVNIYDNAIKHLDYEIGCFLHELEKEGISCDESYIVLLADHGEQFMEHGSIGHGFLYDEILHVPLIISGPGIEKRTVIKDQVPLLDIGPTIVDLLGIPKVKSFQGTSLLPLIRGKDHKKRNVISEAVHRTVISSHCFRTEEWKYIRVLKESTSESKEELYNLYADPEEKENLIGIEKIKADGFRLNILNHCVMEEKYHGKPNEIRDTEVYSIEDKRKIRDRLKDLGYI